MPAQLEIVYQGIPLLAVPQFPHGEEEKRFSIRWQGRDEEIYLKQDNEGAPHWFIASLDKETKFSQEVGLLIEMKEE
jgi:hypothetical protein